MSEKATRITPHAYFTRRLHEAVLLEKQAQTRVNRLALLRLSCFVVALLALWQGGYWLVLSGGASVLFVALIGQQQAARLERDKQRYLQQINRDELGRLQLRFERPDTGSHFVKPTHPYATDLDIFGNHSLYRLLNRTRTAEGSRRLADWLLTVPALETSHLRQEAVGEAATQPDWGQAWEAEALRYPLAAQQVDALLVWIQQPLPEHLQAGLRWRWLGVGTLLLTGAWLLGGLPGWPVALTLLGHGLLLRRYQERVQTTTSQTYTLGQTLAAYAALLKRLEDVPFQSRWWKEQRQAAHHAPAAVAALARWFARLDYRHNVFFAFLVGIPSFWDLHCLAALERWKQQHRERLPLWLDALAETEALNSLAGFAFAQPEYSLPQLTRADDLHVEAEALGHPLLRADQRITNDFAIHGVGETILITGSNMSGKSTFLRTLGCNLVLALAGAPVCAKRLSCSPLRVFTSMRTTDSLEENTSSFYAELKRLRQLLEAAQQPGQPPILYFLDEILKGTNSADRHRGAQALIRQLHALPASGLVSTHDLALGDWAKEQTYVRNFHFRSDVQDGKLHFDYQLRAGVCASFNASELMRMMGIEIPD